MGMDIYGYTFVGLKIHQDNLLQKSKVKAFDHNYPENMKFSPETGKPLWKTEEKSVVPEFDLDKEKIGPFEIERVDYESDYIFLGKTIGRVHHEGPWESLAKDDVLKVLIDVEGYLKTVLPEGIFKKENFGVWTLMYCSY